MQSKEKNIRKDFMQINVTFYFLYLLEPTIFYREKFDDISKVVRVKTENLTKVYEDFDFVGEPALIWDQIPGNDTGRLLEFLRQNYDINWVKTAEIDKIDNDNTISVHTEKNSLLLKLNPERTKVNLTIDEVRREDEFVVKTKNNQRKIHPTSNSEDWCKLEKDFEGDKWEVKYYKERIILKVTTKINAENLNDLFKKAKKKRKKLLEHKLANLEEIQKQWCEICECIQSVYMYPLIEVDKDYKLTDFDLEDEAITTFFYGMKTLIKLIVCDIEGCLTPGKGKPLNLDALSKIKNYNCESKKQRHIPPITLCTGRSLPYVEAMMQAIDGYIPAISENGAGLYDPIKDDYQIHPQITQQTKRQMIEAKNIINEHIINNFRAKFEWGKDFVISVNPPSNISIEEFFNIVQDNLKMYNIDLNITHSASAVDITPKGIDKFAGLQFLLEKLQLCPEDVAGIGDTRGDFPFLKKVGFSAAPNNATDEVKQIVNYVSDYENGNGVVDIIKHCIYLNQS